MAVPKRKTSTHRQGRRRAGQKKIKCPQLTKCRSCGALKKPHYACPNCGKNND